MGTCIFCAIASGAVSSEIVYRGEHVIGFRDIHPQAPVHVLVIPRRHIATLNDLTEADDVVWLEMHRAIRQVARELELDAGYRVVVNCQAAAGQTVFHLHAHVLGGRSMHWPPG